MDTFQLESSLQTVIGEPSEWKIQLHSALQSRGKSQTLWSYYTSAPPALLLNYVTRMATIRVGKASSRNAMYHRSGVNGS